MIHNLGKFAHAKKQGRMPITGGKTEMRPRNPSTNSTQQVTQVQSQISAPPAPFKTTQGIVNTPAPGTMQNGSTFKPTAGLAGAKAPAHPPKQYTIKSKGKMVGVNFPGKKVKHVMNASAKKGGHSLLYGD